MKKVVFLLAAVILILAGCSQDALIVAESMKNSFDVKSYESQTTVSLTSNLPTDEMDEQSKLLLGLLKDGIVLDAKQKSAEEAYLRLTPKNAAAVTDTLLWPYKTAPAIDIYAKGSTAWLKSSVDPKFLGISSEEVANLQQELNDSLKQLAKQYIDQFDYTFKDAKTIGQETVSLPNGDKVDTTHVQITIDMQEALEVSAYLLDNLSKFEDLKAFSELAGVPNGTELQSSMSELAQQIKSLKAEELKTNGYDANLVVDFWINADKQMVQDSMQVHFTVPGSLLSGDENAKPIDLNLAVSSQTWNFDKAVDVAFPSADQVITTEQIAKDSSLLDAFDPASPILMLAALFVTPEAEPFDDVAEDHWAAKQISALRQMEIISGYSDNTFRPERTISRAEFITMAVNAMGLEPQEMKLTFKDNKQIPDWAESSIQTAVKEGIVDGYKDGTIRPNQPMTRSEMVVILVKGYQMDLVNDKPLTFTDDRIIPSWASIYIQTAAANGLVTGYRDGSFAPYGKAKRSEVAAVLYNVLTQGDKTQ